MRRSRRKASIARRAAGLRRRHEALGVNLVHLAEFHGDGHPKDPGPLRLPEMQAMFDECRRWSDDKLLLDSRRRGQRFLGLKVQGKHPGHWMSLFPRPVYWTMVRGPDQPFVEEDRPLRQGLSRRRSAAT